MTSPSSTPFRMLRALRRQCVREATALVLYATLMLQSATAVAPGWWGTQQVLIPGAAADDYTVANLGQLKSVAKKAAAEMNNVLPGGAGTDINALIADWNAAPGANVTRDDYAALTIGQLKNVVSLFYDRLAGAGVTPTGTYPWSGRNADDYALANLGQMKTVFSFEMDTGDANQNGIPDVWELQMFGNLNQVAGGDFDQDGLSNLAEYQTGTDPANTDTDGDGVSDGQEVADGTDPANPPPSSKWTQAQLAAAEAAYEIGLQQRRREASTDVFPSGGGPNPEDAVTYEYWTYLDDDHEHEIWTGSCTTNELGTATELANGAKAAHPKVDLAPLKEWEPISPSGGTGVAVLTSSGGVEAYATIERGVGTAKAEFRLVRRLKDGATAPEDLEGNLIKPEIKRTYLKVTTIVTDTGTTTTTAEAVELTIPEGDDISETTSGELFPPVTTEGSYGIALLAVELYTDLNNDGQLTSADADLVGKPYKSGASEKEKAKGTEYMFANDQISNGAHDREDTTTEDPSEDDDDAEGIHINAGVNAGKVWLDHPAIDALTFYKQKSCYPAEKLNLKEGDSFDLEGAEQLPATIYARCDETLQTPKDNPQLLGDLVLNYLPKSGGHYIQLAKTKLTVVQKLGAVDHHKAALDYIQGNNTTHYTNDVVINSVTVSFVVLWESKTDVRGINAANGPYKGINAIASSADWKDMTSIINASYAYSVTNDNGFFKLHDGELIHSGAWDSSCSVKQATSHSGRHNYIASYGEGKIAYASGDVPPNAQEGSGGMAILGSGPRHTSFTSIARVTVGAEHLIVLGSSGCYPTIWNYPYNKYITAVQQGSSATTLLDPDGGASCALAVADSSGKLITKQTSPRNGGAGSFAYSRWLKTYLGFKSSKPRTEL